MRRSRPEVTGDASGAGSSGTPAGWTQLLHMPLGLRNTRALNGGASAPPGEAQRRSQALFGRTIRKSSPTLFLRGTTKAAGRRACARRRAPSATRPMSTLRCMVRRRFSSHNIAIGGRHRAIGGRHRERPARSVAQRSPVCKTCTAGGPTAKIFYRLNIIHVVANGDAV
jgi:hypothetical protein